MTKAQLNNAVKKVYTQYKNSLGGEATNEYFQWLDATIKPEIQRLYMADTSLKALSADNLRRLLSLNVSLRVIPSISLD